MAGPEIIEGGSRSLVHWGLGAGSMSLNWTSSASWGLSWRAAGQGGILEMLGDWEFILGVFGGWCWKSRDAGECNGAGCL